MASARFALRNACQTSNCWQYYSSAVEAWWGVVDSLVFQFWDCVVCYADWCIWRHNKHR
jgi:hypothetical protein